MFYDAIQISKINDFLFCPYSIYLHNIYEDHNELIYHKDFQQRGKINHHTIDSGKYSSQISILQALPIFSEKHNLIGKIDLYDKNKKLLIERKYYIKHIFLGQKIQVFSQALCMQEMGYKVNKICLHSLKDNKRYFIPYPNLKLKIYLIKILLQMQQYKPQNRIKTNINKCKMCIYNTLCIHYKNDNFS